MTKLHLQKFTGLVLILLFTGMMFEFVSQTGLGLQIQTKEERYLGKLRSHRSTFNRNNIDYLRSQYTASRIDDVVESLTSSEISNILQECHQINDDLSHECVEALDSIFLNFPTNVTHASNGYFDPLQLAKRLTHADTFLDPMRDLQLVSSVLATPECRLDEQQTIRPALNQKCSADSLFRVHLIELNCEIFEEVFAGFPDLFNTQNENQHEIFRSTLEGVSLDKHTDDESEDKDGINARRRAREKDEFWDVVLHTRWMLKRCERLDLSEVRRFIGEKSQSIFYEDKLHALAIRLGNEQALLHNILDFNRKYESLMEYYKTQFLWLLDYLHTAESYRWPVSFTTEVQPSVFDYIYEMFQQRLITYLQTMHHADRQGWEYDLNTFAREFCVPFTVIFNSRKPVWPGDCSWLVYGIRKGKKISSSELTARLDAFERAAIAAEVYHLENTPSAEQVFEIPDLEGDHLYEKVVSVTPYYPPYARIQNLEGFVEVGFTITETGAITNVHVKSSGPGKKFHLDAMNAVLFSRYRPTIRDGQPVQEDSVSLIIEFKLEDED
ncbi:MAG: energy transducer TonB [Gammaproteobacteria bacterium]|nr:energy transducer TonB [Gammaproteobacteria bacterium]MDE0253084.1 energy transducer TonB [Gammaproteobacteria bacterium]MDE0402272.1 energy transducer TonB [Gammaproteobacteria bacterium]